MTARLGVIPAAVTVAFSSCRRQDRASSRDRVRRRRSVRRLALAFLVAGLCAGGASPTLAVSADVVVSQVYGGGGNTGAPYTNDFIELFNRGAATVSLTGWSVQYASATGTANFGASTAQITDLSGSIAPGQYVLIQEGAGAGSGSPLPTPDVTDATPIAMGATGGKVALVNTITPLGCNGGTTPCGSSQLATIIDLVGYGNADFFEGSGPTPAPSNTSSVSRAGAGCTDTDNNTADFTAGAPNPRNSASPITDCFADAAPSVTSTSPASGASNVTVDASVSITFSELVSVGGSWYSISCASSGSHTAAVSGGPTTFTLNPDSDFAGGETCTVGISAAGVTDQDTDDPPDAMAADVTFSFR